MPRFRARVHCRDPIAKFIRELYSKMTQTADTLHRNKVAGHGTALPQRAKCSNSGAKQWCRFDVT